jgi:hypothetical protein
MKLTIPQLYIYNKIVKISMLKFEIQHNEAINYIDNIIKKIKKNIPFVIEI